METLFLILINNLDTYANLTSFRVSFSINGAIVAKK